MVGEVGNDEWSQRSLAAMKDEGVSTALMSVLDRPLPSLSVCMTHEGDRGFLTYDVPSVEPGLSCAVNVLMAVEREDARFLLCYLGSSVAAYAPIARKRGITVVADCSWDEAWLTSAEMKAPLSLTDVLFANEPEARAITGESDPIAALHALAERVPFVVVKQGAKGASAIVDGQEYHAATESGNRRRRHRRRRLLQRRLPLRPHHDYPIDDCLALRQHLRRPQRRPTRWLPRRPDRTRTARSRPNPVRKVRQIEPAAARPASRSADPKPAGSPGQPGQTSRTNHAATLGAIGEDR